MSTTHVTKRPIVLVGGGTGGHIFPVVALVEALRVQSPDAKLIWMGEKGRREQFIAKDLDIPFVSIRSGKWRRYFSLRNIIDLAKVKIGILQAFGYFVMHRPAVVISKGGYQALPVIVAARVLRIPLIAHESDSVAGIATRLAERLGGSIAITWPETKGLRHPERATTVGLPVRRDLLHGDAERARKLLDLPTASPRGKKPVLLVIGGSQGAQAINRLVYDARQSLLKMYAIVHITGEAHLDQYVVSNDDRDQGYRVLPFLNEELADVYALAQVAIARSGSGIIELLANGIPTVAIPLPSAAADHQTRNAHLLAERDLAILLPEKDITLGALTEALARARSMDRMKLREAIRSAGLADGAERLRTLLA